MHIFSSYTHVEMSTCSFCSNATSCGNIQLKIYLLSVKEYTVSVKCIPYKRPRSCFFFFNCNLCCSVVLSRYIIAF